MKNCYICKRNIEEVKEDEELEECEEFKEFIESGRAEYSICQKCYHIIQNIIYYERDKEGFFVFFKEEVEEMIEKKVKEMLKKITEED